MSTSNAWAEFADVFIRTRDAHFEHEKAKSELKSLMPEDAQQLDFTVIGPDVNLMSRIERLCRELGRNP